MSYECVCDWDAPTWSRHSQHTARKPHRCDECGTPILPGERYTYDCGLSDGNVYASRTCGPCTALYEWAKISVPCFCYLLGDLHSAVREMVGEVSVDVPGLVMEWGRRMVAIRRAAKMKRALA